MFTFFRAGWQHQGFPVAKQRGSNPRRSAKRPKMCTKCTCKINSWHFFLLFFCLCLVRMINPLLIQGVDQVTVDVRGEWVGGFGLLLLLLLLLLLPLFSILGKVNPLLWDHPCLVVIIFIVLAWPTNWSLLGPIWRSHLPKYRNTRHIPPQWNLSRALS